MKTRLLLFTIFLMMINSVFAQTGALDPNFGNNGIVVSGFNGKLCGANSVLTESNGKILVTGFVTNANGNRDFALVRYNSDGSIDQSFGSNGYATYDFRGADDQAQASVMQNDGKIITVGYATVDTIKYVAVARFNADGSIDKTYGTNGVYIYNDKNGNNLAKSVCVLSDNSTVVGCKFSNGSLSDYALLKLNSSGVSDSTFGTNGVVVTNIGGSDDLGEIKLQDDGKIVLIGTSSIDSTTNPDYGFDLALIRYNSDGSLDTSFNSTGIVTTSFEKGSEDGGTSLDILSNHKILVCGSDYVGSAPDNFAMSRYNSDGTIDSTFGVNGSTITDFNNGYDLSYSSLVQSDGKIILGGYSIDGTTYNYNFAVARYLSDGTIDSTFGTYGKTITDVSTDSQDYGYSLAFNTDHDAILAGWSKPKGGTFNITLAQYGLDSQTGISQFRQDHSDFLLYPNPANGYFHIKSDKSNERTASVTIYTIAGRQVKQLSNYHLHDAKGISVKSLAKGEYFLKVVSGKNSSVLKLLVQ